MRLIDSKAGRAPTKEGTDISGKTGSKLAQCSILATIFTFARPLEHQK